MSAYPAQEPQINNGVKMDDTKKRPRDGTSLKFKEECGDPETDNLRVGEIRALIYPQLLLETLPISPASKSTVLRSRQNVERIIRGTDDRLLVVVGPCSIHDPVAAMEYARKLTEVSKEYEEFLVIIMRVYFEKPRTTIGWKGLVNDPMLDGSFRINQGLHLARELLLNITSLGLGVGCEFLDSMIPQYIADLVSWGAIGARTTECQLHRELASGLSMPVGFKNGTGGDAQIAVQACTSASAPHSFLGINKQGLASIVHSEGNPDLHVILRGSRSGTNYSSEDVKAVAAQLRKAQTNSRLIIDCSHGNSQKDHKKQPLVVSSICEQLSAGEEDIAGCMMESHLFEGAQELPTHLGRKYSITEENSSARGGILMDRFSVQRPIILDQLQYGVSITDKCMGWDDTVAAFSKLANAVRTKREGHKLN